MVATYQSVSGAGKEAMDELFSQTKAVFQLDEIEAKKFPKRIAFNVIPQIDVFMEDGYTKEEWKMVVETKKILDPKIKLIATCVRVPVFVGHSEAVNIEFENPITPDEARDILRNAPGCLVIDSHEPGGYVTPYEAAGEDATYISRIREDATVENGLSMWIVSDNLRKGAALNAIQIAECLINRKLITASRRRRDACLSAQLQPRRPLAESRCAVALQRPPTRRPSRNAIETERQPRSDSARAEPRYQTELTARSSCIACEHQAWLCAEIPMASRIARAADIKR